METFLVGGAVRDQFMGLDPKDEDWVVVGSTPEEMIAHGFEQVGADFPVFLDMMGNEFALARTERKVGAGHKGFVTDHSPDVTLEEDLMRRDFTMNAMAKLSDGSIFDPFNGRRDILKQEIRHVSDAFREDPLRVLRAARFAARFNFAIAPETMALMMDMVTEGELNNLTTERVWKEVQRAMMEPHPHRFIEVIDAVDAMEIVFGESWEVMIDAIHALAVAGRHDVSEHIRWMMVFEDWNAEAALDITSHLGMPNDLARSCRFAPMMADALRRRDMDAVVDVAGRHRLFSDGDLLMIQFAAAMGFMRGIDNDECRMVDKLLLAISQAGRFSFNSLDERRRIMLRGPDIGRAIASERRKILDRVMGW